MISICCDTCRTALSIICPICGVTQGDKCRIELPSGGTIERTMTHLARRIAYARRRDG